MPGSHSVSKFLLEAIVRPASLLGCCYPRVKRELHNVEDFREQHESVVAGLLVGEERHALTYHLHCSGLITDCFDERQRFWLDGYLAVLVPHFPTDRCNSVPGCVHGPVCRNEELLIGLLLMVPQPEPVCLIALHSRLSQQPKTGGEGGEGGAPRPGCSRDHCGKSCVHEASLPEPLDAVA
ncbi:hypothetical protein [Streptomyces griseus]|uniref:hypothetical protein n=1 Tax=Streptomyces griseus TaxID=1911 RepID=UPI003807C263